MAPLITPAEAATYLSMSTRTLEHWRSKLKGPPYLKLEGKIRYDTSALAAWVDESAKTGQP